MVSFCVHEIPKVLIRTCHAWNIPNLFDNRLRQSSQLPKELPLGTNLKRTSTSWLNGNLIKMIQTYYTLVTCTLTCCVHYTVLCTYQLTIYVFEFCSKKWIVVSLGVYVASYLEAFKWRMNYFNYYTSLKRKEGSIEAYLHNLWYQY